ncbi:hypothetical protein SAMN05414139_01202 [Burkholderia sp. D7]|nr:hypothetical protein SAMN05414139_01202 [Burkholderia sp. D7]
MSCECKTLTDITQRLRIALTWPGSQYCQFLQSQTSSHDLSVLQKGARGRPLRRKPYVSFTP